MPVIELPTFKQELAWLNEIKLVVTWWKKLLLLQFIRLMLVNWEEVSSFLQVQQIKVRFVAHWRVFTDINL